MAVAGSRGSITLPADVRRRYHLDEPGAQVEVIAALAEGLDESVLLTGEGGLALRARDSLGDHRVRHVQ